MKHWAVMENEDPNDKYVTIEFHGQTAQLLKADAVEFCNEIRREAMPKPIGNNLPIPAWFPQEEQDRLRAAQLAVENGHGHV